MAEGFEVYHVPQQSRRDKLRVGGGTAHNNNNNFHIAAAAGLQFPLYDDPSSNFISSSDLVHGQDFHHHNPLSQIQNHTTPFHTPSFYPLLPPEQPLSLELNLQQRYGGSVAAPPQIFSPPPPPPPPPIHDSVVPLAGYASILKASRFLRPAQQLLEDLFDYANGNPPSDKLPPDSALLVDPLLETLGGDVPAAAAAADHDPMTCDDSTEGRRKKSRLISMLDEVYRRYKQYYQQMQAVVTTFEYVAGLGNAAPYVNLAVKAMFKHFRFLKNAIADQLQFNKQQQSRPYSPYCQRSIHSNAAFLDHQPVWRPQRGLPESAVTVLRAWLFEHFLHPYPTDTDKLMLANQTGLSRSQVSNWFINARVRLWKPMVEEIHMLETRQAQKSQQQREPNANANALNNDHLSSTNESLKPDGHHNNNNTNPNANASSSNHDHHSLDLSNPNIFPSHHPHAATGAPALGSGGGGGSVSLTLGLHQNHGHGGIALSEPFPINAAQHFNLGLEANGEGFVNEWF